jgi:uncharacterized protein YidB (DUF937 family)
MTPAQAAAWIRRETNLPINRKQVSNWLNRGQLPTAAKEKDGIWKLNPVELLDRAEKAA